MAMKKKGPDQHWAEIKEKLIVGLEQRRPFERQWILNLAFLSGNQYVAFNTTAHMLHRIAKAPHKMRAVDNIILPKWKRQVSNLIKARPKITVVPNSVQEEDIAAAKMGAKVAEWYYKNTVMKSKIRSLASWIYATGNAFLDDAWNPKGGPMAVNKKTGDVVYAGDVDASVWSPFEIVAPFRFGAAKPNDLPWIAKYQRKELEWFEENFDRGGEVKEEPVGSNYLTLESLISNIVGTTQLGKVKSAYAINLYIKPCRKYPRGCFFSAANGIVFEKMDYPFNEFPIEHFKELEYPGIFWGDSTTTHAIPLQRSWNNDISSMEEFNRRVGKPKLLNPSGSQLNVVPNDQTGEIINYKPVLGHKPDYLNLKGLSPTLKDNMQRIMVSMENLYSQHEVTRGTNKSDIRSGEMVGLLLEQDSFGDVPSHAIFEESLECHISRILRRVQVGYTTERTIKLGNTDDDLEVLSFKGADLRSNNDVSIVPDSTLPDSAAAREVKVGRRYQAGLYGDPADPRVKRKVLRMLDDHVVDDVYSGEKQDEMLQNWENRKMLQGVPAAVNNYDNHQVHIEELDRIRKSVRYQKLRDTSPATFFRIDNLFTQHRQLHVAFVNEEMKRNMMLMQAQQGGQG